MITRAEAAARRMRGLGLARAGRGDGLPQLTVEVLGTFNLDLLPPFLIEALDRVAFAARVAARPLGRMQQEIIDPDSHLYASRPDAVVLVVSAEDAQGAYDERLAELRTLVATLLERAQRATVVVCPLGADRLPAEHVLDPGAAERGQAAIERYVRGVRALAGNRVLVADWEWRVRQAGADATHDPRLWYLARMRLGPVGLAHLAELLAEHLAASFGSARKVCAVDLDDVLWGGVVGEDGVAGLTLGEEGVGLAFQDLQRVLLGLRETGVLLAIASKNEAQDAHHVFEQHVGMVLRHEHFSAERVNWQDKATNLHDLAEELGLGLDSFVFLDDDPVEREWVRTALPEVVVPELPDDPAERPDFLRRAPYFQRIRVTSEDSTRAESYRSDSRRRDFRSRLPSLEEFVAKLEQRVVLEPVHDGSLGRAVQLAQRTNQFNLTNRRYSLAELDAVIADPAIEAYTLALSDRFGDSGVTGLAVLRFSEDEAEIESFLLSCRVLGRRLDDALLAFLAERAEARGARLLVGQYVPSGKNDQVRGFYGGRGFSDDGGGRFVLELARGHPPAPAGIDVELAARA